MKAAMTLACGVERQRLLIERLVAVEHRLQPEETFHALAAGVTINGWRPLDSGDGGGDVAGRDQIACLAITHHLSQSATRVRDDRRTRRLRLARDQPKRLLPVRWAEDGQRLAHQPVEVCTRHIAQPADTLAQSLQPWRDALLVVARVVDVARQRQRQISLLGDGQRILDAFSGLMRPAKSSDGCEAGFAWNGMAARSTPL